MNGIGFRARPISEADQNAFVLFNFGSLSLQSPTKKVARNQTRRYRTQGRNSSVPCLYTRKSTHFSIPIVFLTSSQCRSRYVFSHANTIFSKEIISRLNVLNGRVLSLPMSKSWLDNQLSESKSWRMIGSNSQRAGLDLDNC